MAHPILVTALLLKQGKAVRAMVRNEDERAQALRDMDAEVVVGNLLDLEAMHRVIAGCETMYFSMSVSDAYLAATVNAAAVAKHHGVQAFINMSQMALAQMSMTDEHGTWGGEIRREFAPQPGDIVALEHWCSSGFADTDLDVQLKKHGIHQLILMGLRAHTCVEATVRYAAGLGYEVTMVKDATASYLDEEMHAALDIISQTTPGPL